ncbi:PLP-dependent aminotransferase family protein [Agrobacterium rhizogenes]|uniref:MocR-like pyridoxine biosynthesis transcription factor PdxR n=1 Tax=Rhizobium rhizogenes TaxID=359 RepID=UPI0004D7FB1F|nr:PLP-dependent aminotransferase family protein [Rhizobium rhizogenes]OCJ31765.1 aspartate aminotransferase [Agrobacterium sp. B133/95]KEA07457.1 aspartate aminotransferase [Rhizobium rhizogenes]MQB29063.1 PLP-dependent aminotransferase family protein [Rhizobium rhizogenes]NTF67402.1 PLP-dependent aminotransferase family protein [Rhizobium rhizogenes]NTI28134.1 PLP-dependent aminotransferase family protein [Rhizobium rhizogenes]
MEDQSEDGAGDVPRLGARRIYEELKAQIANGIYASGSPMPSTRSLAAELGVARSTVTIAYEQLLSEGFIESRQGARTRVAMLRPVESPPEQAVSATTTRRNLSAYGERLQVLPHPPQHNPSKLIADFRYGDLAASDFPTLLWKRAVDDTVKRRRDRLAYDDPCGSLALRTALQAYLWRARGIRCELGQLIIVNGSQQGLDLCTRLLVDPGDAVVIEDPCYAMARNVFAAIGATVVPVPADHEGLRTDLLQAIDARLAYVTPSHQFPLGGVMPIGRRNALLAWSRHCGAYVIEDDYDGEYRYDIAPVPPLQTLGGAGNVIYLGTLSKTLSPTLRLGYMVVPLELAEVFAAAKRLTDRHSPQLEQEAAATLIATGAYERHIRRTRRRNAARRATLLAALRAKLGDRLTIVGADAGLHVIVWCNTISAREENQLIERARQARIGLYPVTPTYAAADAPYRPDRAGFIIGYASLDEHQIERGVDVLATVLL